MRIRVKNFGPIRYVDIDLKPLTIAIGKNNLGKSFVAQLLYVLVTSIQDFAFPRHVRYAWHTLFYGGMDADEIETRRIAKRVRDEGLTDQQIVAELVRIILDANAKVLQATFKGNLERAFGPKLSSLININSSSAQIECDIFEYLEFVAELKKREQVGVHLRPLAKTIPELTKQSSQILEKIRQKRQKQRYILELASSLQERLSTLKSEIPMKEEMLRRYGRSIAPSYYVPAGRGGLIESFDLVVDSLIYDASIAPSEGLYVSALPGMSAQFYRVLRSLNGNKGPLNKDISKPFRDLLGGDIRLLSIRLRKGDRPIRTRMMYDFRLGNKRSSTELIHAASMIKELAPIYLILLELIRPGQLLIVEEPESHLHPGAQFKLARILSILTKRGVNVFLTTHSTALVRKISHLLGRLPTEEEAFLPHGSVGMYWLKEGRLGSISKKLKISKYGTLAAIPTFDEAINELYEEEEALQREVQQEEEKALGGD
jgi:hypothetical protein